jgi:hypothetical protein
MRLSVEVGPKHLERACTYLRTQVWSVCTHWFAIMTVDIFNQEPVTLNLI